jgi:serine protease Do
MESSNRFGQGIWNKIRQGRLTTTFTILAVISASFLAGSMLTGHVSAKQKVDSSDARQLVIPNPVTLSNGFSAIAKQVGPAVVNINTETLPKQTPPGHGRNAMPLGPRGGDQGDQDGQGDQGMQDFFNHFFGGPGGGGGQDAGPSRALGSGFIVDSRGYIITNNHVVEGR